MNKAVEIPKMKGLVLAGGKSERMGMDKGTINYHSIPQREFVAELLNKFCEKVFISSNTEFESTFEIIPDSIHDLGPLGGILTAFENDRNTAWLVVATDIPLINEQAISQLIDGRDTSKVATCFHNQDTGSPEPLVTIWEPKAYEKLLHFQSLGFFSPRKVLVNSDIKILQIKNHEVLLQANTPAERDKLITIIAN